MIYKKKMVVLFIMASLHNSNYMTQTNLLWQKKTRVKNRQQQQNKGMKTGGIT